MPGSSQDTSFIPKNNTNRRKRTARRGNVYILNIISYVIFFSALLAAIGVFFYDRYVTSQFGQEVLAMSNEVSSFKEADMERVIDFDQRLRKANERIERSVSVVSIFDALEAATANKVRFDSFSLVRDKDEKFTIESKIETDTFDSSMFQRDTFGLNDVVDVVEVQDLVIADVTTESGLVYKSVSFVANLSIPLSAVPYRPTGASPFPVESPTLETGETPAASSTESAAVVSEDSNDPETAVINEPTL